MPFLLHHLIQEAAESRPEGVAIRWDGSSLPYSELVRQANGLAHVLLDSGMERRERVAVLLTKSPKVAISFYGVFKAGGILVPVDPRSPAEQIARILQATGVTRLVTEAKKAAVLREALTACPAITHVIGFEEGEPAEEAPREAFRRIPWSEVREASDAEAPPIAITEMDPAYILHTSGSTGVPKLIQHTHRSALSFVDWATREYVLRPEDRLTNHSSHHTCFATFDYYAAARAGAATVLLTPAAMMMPASLAALLESERASVWYSVPTALVQLSLRGVLEARDLSALRWILFAGETFPEKHLRRLRDQLPGARFSHVYGSTEVNVCTAYHLPEDGGFPTPLPIGKACSNASTLVVNDALEPVPDGDEGELLVRGSTVMSGYWGDPERNRRALLRRPAAGNLDEVYFRTGDQVRVLDDGNLAFVARTDLQIKVRGFRVELGEIEAALLSVAGVEQAAAFAVPDGEGSSAIRAAVVVAAVQDAPEEAEIRGALQKILPMQAIPSKIAVLPALPLTPTGKVDRNALRARWTH